MKKQTLITLISAIAVVVVLVAAFAGQGGTSAEVQPTATPEATVDPSVTEVPEIVPTAAPTEKPSLLDDITFDFAGQIPAEYADILIHEQEIHDGLITEVFSMRNEVKDISLYRIDFGNEFAGDWLGVIHTENGMIHVTYTVFALTEEQLALMSEEEMEQYNILMGHFSEMLNVIFADPRFTTEKPLAVGEDVEVQTTYWTLMLPSNMVVMESNENGTYVAVFYGEVAGELTALYTVHIGDDKAESELGLYDVDGEKKPVSVGSFDLSEQYTWTDDDYSAAYRMMDTINHVIETIMTSKQFSMPE
ncbi:MAG: hypothetical protein IKJ65_04530 [Clostridia bacterium]|nr:hypothetical protein [Clostridia bacterium]